VVARVSGGMAGKLKAASEGALAPTKEIISADIA
jgi:hypothetical protein